MSNTPPPESERHISPDSSDDVADQDNVKRQLLLHRYLSECMGGILPTALDLSQVKRVLDVESGAGAWVYDLAWRYPSMQVTGIESHHSLAKEAQALARRAGNAEVIEQDLRSLSDQIVPLASFDMVHARFLVRRLTLLEFPSTLAALASRCRAGALLVWEEPEYPLTNSLACEQLYRLIQAALKAAGRAFSPGTSLGITAMMSNWLKASGCRITLDTAYALDISARMTTGQQAFQQHLQLMRKRLRPFLIQTDVTTETDFEALCTQARQESAGADFRGVAYVRTLVGTVERG